MSKIFVENTYFISDKSFDGDDIQETFVSNCESFDVAVRYSCRLADALLFEKVLDLSKN